MPIQSFACKIRQPNWYNYNENYSNNPDLMRNYFWQKGYHNKGWCAKLTNCCENTIPFNSLYTSACTVHISPLIHTPLSHLSYSEIIISFSQFRGSDWNALYVDFFPITHLSLFQPQPCKRRCWSWFCWPWRMAQLFPERCWWCLLCRGWSHTFHRLPRPASDMWCNCFTEPPASRYGMQVQGRPTHLKCECQCRKKLQFGSRIFMESRS